MLHTCGLIVRMTDSDIEDNDEPQSDRPEKDELIKSYIQYSEESRYRDGLMHNSYYFILISVVIFSGHILSLNPKGPLLQSPRVGFTLLSGGVAASGIGAILITYNRKKINAEDQRHIIEKVLDDEYTKTGIFKDYGKEHFEPRREDNPFAIQSKVTSRTRGRIDRFFVHTVPINVIAIISIVLGLIVIMMGAGIISAPISPYW